MENFTWIKLFNINKWSMFRKELSFIFRDNDNKNTMHKIPLLTNKLK